MSCKHHRIISVCAKCSDMCFVSLCDQEYDGYVPGNIGIGCGDYVEFDYCADCGQLMGTWPLPSELKLNEEED